MTISYHELTHGNRNPKAERQQTFVVFIITAAYLLWSAISAGLFAPMTFQPDSTFSGGEFVYKLITNDYVASSGAIMTIASDLGIDETGLEKPRGTVDFLYTVFLDDAAIIPGGKTRFASGALLTKGDNDVKPRLIDVNKTILGKSEGKQSKYIRYEVGALPKVEAVAMNHPFTGGAWSSFLMRFKIVPAFRTYSKKQTKSNKNPIIISTCCEKQSMCTFYMPLSQEKKFYLGKQTTEEYAQEFSNDGFLKKIGVDIDFDKFTGGIDLRKVLRGLKKTIGFDIMNKGKDEL